MQERLVGGPYEAIITTEQTDQPGVVRVTARWTRNGQVKQVSAEVAEAIGDAFAQHWGDQLVAGAEPPE